jgi:hypothetical protein
VCIDYMSDPNHCGACNHSCLAGGLCIGEACQPVALAIQQDEPMGVVVDSDYAYFVNYNANTVVKVSKTGSGSCVGTACPTLSSATLNQPVSIATSDTGGSVFVANYADGKLGNVVEIPKGMRAGDEHVVASAKGLWAIAMSGTNVFYSTRKDTRLIGRVGDTATATLVGATAVSGEVTALATDSDFIFFGTQQGSDGDFSVGIFKTAPGSSCNGHTCYSIASAAAAGKPKSIFASRDYLFWTADDDKIRRVAKSCAGLGSCTVMVLAEGQLDPQTIVADDDFVYWANAGDGTIRKTSVYRYCKGVACQAITPRLGQLYGLAQDKSALYITSRSSGAVKTGILWRVAK